MAIKKYYAVAVGRHPGIYTQWFGPAGAHAQVEGFKGARYKGFPTIEAARAFIADHAGKPKEAAAAAGTTRRRSSPVRTAPASAPDVAGRTIIYTDGCSLGNPGPGGYGVVIPNRGADKEYSGGFRRTTNNRMELMACIVGLEQLGGSTPVALYSDSRYVVDGITKGWAKNWRRRGWCKGNGQAALNADLWARLLDLCDRHDVRFVWVKGHAGNPGNERCDELANQAARQGDLSVDKGYDG